MKTPEADLAVQLRQRLYYTAPRVKLVAVPNAGKRGFAAVRQAKKEGLATGFPDLVALAPGGKVAFLELKAPKGRLSDNQREWISRLRDMGFAADVFRETDAAIDWLCGLGFPILERRAPPPAFLEDGEPLF